MAAGDPLEVRHVLGQVPGHAAVLADHPVLVCAQIMPDDRLGEAVQCSVRLGRRFGVAQFGAHTAIGALIVGWCW